MAEGSLLCANASCQRPACRFGFVEGTSKLAVCPEHMSTLSVQGLPTFEIAAYDFMNSVEDESLYRQKAEQAEAGRKNISTLEERCDTDLREVERLLESVGDLKSQEVEIRAHSRECCEAMKQRLKETQLHLNQLVKNKEMKLSAHDATLCGAPCTGPLFTLGQDEEEVHYLELTEIGAELMPSLAELMRLRVAVGRKGKESWEAGKTVVGSILKSGPQSEVQAVVEGYVSGAVKAREGGNYAKALKKLQRGRVILQQLGQESGLLCMHMGQVQAYYGEWTEAEAELKKGLHYQMSISPTSELAVQLSNSLVEHYHQRGMLDQRIQQAKWTIHTFENTGHAFELLRTLYYYFPEFDFYEDEKEFALMKQWSEEVVLAGPQCVLLCLQAQRLDSCGKPNAAADVYEQALKLEQQFPVYAYLPALAKLRLVHHNDISRDQVYIDSKKGILAFMNHFPQTTAIFDDFIMLFSDKNSELVLSFYSAQFPQSLGHAYYLSQLAYRLANMGEKDAQKYYQEANTILSTRFPNTLEYANHLISYLAVFRKEATSEQKKASLLAASDIIFAHLPHLQPLVRYLWEIREEENPVNAEKHFLRAYQIYLTRFPQALEFVQFVNFFGDFYLHFMDQEEKAVEKYRQAYQLCFELFPKSPCFRILLYELGCSWAHGGRLQSAVEWYAKVLRRLEAEGGQSLFHGKLLSNLADILGENSDPRAEEYFAKACQILSTKEIYSQHYGECLIERAKYALLSDNKQAELYYQKACLAYSYSRHQLRSGVTHLAEFYQGRSSTGNIGTGASAIRKEASESCLVWLCREKDRFYSQVSTLEAIRQAYDS